LSDQRVFISGFSMRHLEINNWRLQRTKTFEVAERMPPTTESVWVNEEQADGSLWLNSYTCDSLEGAHEFLLSVLGESDAAFMKREDPDASTAFGDIAFTDLIGTSMLFSRANMVFRPQKHKFAGPGSNRIPSFIRCFN